MEEPASVAAQQSAPATSEAGTTVEDASEATVKSEAQATAEQAPPEVHREAYPDSQPPQHEQQPIASVDHQLPHIPQELQPGTLVIYQSRPVRIPLFRAIEVTHKSHT